MRHVPFRWLALCAAALVLPATVQAQSRIDEVLVYPGGAQVTRLATVTANARELVLNCLTARFDPDSLQIDAPAGVNLGPVQVEAFHRTAGVTGLVMTKLDGTARGGILVAVAAKFKLPVHFIGVGEGIDDLAPFTARDFAQAIAGIES